MTQHTSIILSNGTFHTMDPTRPRARVLAARGDNLAYVGDDLAEAKRLAPRALHIDLGGRTAVPGLIDSHLHFLHEGQKLSEMDIYWKPKADVLRLVAEEAAHHRPGEWIVGRGWNHEAWNERIWPDKADLDAVAPHNPVALSRADAHSMWVNSMALDRAGLNRDSADPQGGEILRRSDGSPSGILVDTGMFAVWQAIPSLGDEQIRRLYLLAQDEYLSLGLTSIGNANQNIRNHEILARACQDGALKIRVYDALTTHSNEDIAWIAAGRRPEQGKYGERLSARAIKIVSDGSLGSRSAWLLRDYVDRPGHQGNGRYSDEELHALIMRGRNHGFQVWLHAIGDAAVRQAVAAYGRALAEHPLPDHRYRIEHFQVAEPGEIKKTVALGLIPAMQAAHLSSDWKMAAQRLAPESLRNAYPWRNVLAAGGIIAGGSDSPMDQVNPFYGLYASIARKDLHGEPASGWWPDQRLTREEALKSYTVWAAYAEFAETRKGMLRPGMLADVAVLDRDIMICPEEDIKDAACLLTILGGEVVYNAL